MYPLCTNFINQKYIMMEPALQRRVQRYGWDKAAAYYESSWQKQLLPAQQKLLAYANIKGGEKIIDIACGTGLVSFPAAELAGNNGFVLGTDISDKMLELSKAIAKERNIFKEWMQKNLLQPMKVLIWLYVHWA